MEENEENEIRDLAAIDPEISEFGRGICLVTGKAEAIEKWVEAVRERSGARVDWEFFSRGNARLLHLGDAKSRERAIRAIESLRERFEGTVMSLGRAAISVSGMLALNDMESAVRRVWKRDILIEPDVAGYRHEAKGDTCTSALALNADSVSELRQIAALKGLDPKIAAVAVLNADDEHGGPLAEALLPGYGWQEIRDRELVPYARGLINRERLTKVLEVFAKGAADSLRESQGIAAVVVDFGTAEVFDS